MSAYPFSVTIRGLFGVFIALALSVAPAMTAGGSAAAHGSDGQMAMMDHSAHCQSPAGSAPDHHKSDGKSCCISMCMALAVTPSVPIEESSRPRQQIAQFAPPKTYHGLLAEIATPPPRIA